MRMTIAPRTTSAISYSDHHVYLMLITRSALFSRKYTNTRLAAWLRPDPLRETLATLRVRAGASREGDRKRGREGKRKGEGLNLMKNSYFRP